MRASAIQYIDEVGPPTPLADLQYVPRNRYQALLFVPMIFFSGMSWMVGGVPILTDVSFLILTILCIAQVVEELLVFSRRFGLGGITLFGGILAWFCHDYMTNWFFIDFTPGVTLFTPLVVAKSAFLHQSFILSAVVGLHLPIWRRLENFCANLPDPASHQIYLSLIFITFFIGMVPYIFFSGDIFPISLWKSIFAGRTGSVGFTVGRTGNVNSSWGAYLAQFEEVGEIGAIFSIFYVILFTPGVIMSVVCGMIWGIQVALAFGSGTRGASAYILMPAMFLLFLKYQSQAAEMFKRFSMKAYLVSGAVGLFILIVLQIQITYRNVGFDNVQLNEVKTQIEGNTMFSEGLQGMALIPEHTGFFSNSIPGQGAVMAMPNFLWRFAYGPIPRALWANKPIDPLWKWYNAVITGRSEDDLEGTTISTGLVGDWYFRFGMAGVIEGGLLFGWLYTTAERMLQNSQGRIIQLITAIGILIFLFRGFRGVSFINLYPLLIGVTVLTLLIRLGGAKSRE